MMMLDPICDMVIDMGEARDNGLTLEMPEREYAFCGPGCQVKFAKSPAQYRQKFEDWLAGKYQPKAMM
ncbi:MAG: YHS domain-containing protein [Chloroflexi bacterium]|nr:YHS domain-containing protein [Chloroflexota bacterium]